MAVVVARTATNATAVSSAPNVVLSAPSDAAVGDVLIASWTSDTVVSTAPTGWTQLAGVENTPKVYAYSHTYVTGDPTSWTWTIGSGSGWGGCMQAFGGVNSTNLDVAVVTYSNTSGSTVTFPVSNSTVTANDMLVSVLGANTGGSVTPTAPSGWTSDTVVNTGFTSNRANAMAHFTKAATGGPVKYTWTIDSGRAGAAILIALRPSPGVTKLVTGSITASATIMRATGKNTTGTLTSVGSYLRTGFSRSLSGSLTAAGTKYGRLARNTLYGAIFSSGDTQRGYPRAVGGTITAVGQVARTSTRKFLSGLLAGVGAPLKMPTKRTAGSVTGSGVVLKLAAIRRGGSVTGSGSPNQLAQRFRTVAGSLTGIGTVRRISGKRVAGSVTGGGTLGPRTVSKRLAGFIRPVGTATTTLFRRVFGRSATAEMVLAPSVETDASFYLRHRAFMTLSVVSQAVMGRGQMPLDPVVGSRVASETTFRVAGVPVDPDVVTAYIRSPNGVLTTSTYPSPDLVQESPGMYRIEFNADVTGSWWVRIEGTGTYEAAEEQSIHIRPSNVI